MNLVELAPDIFKESVDTGILTLSFPDYPFRLLIELAVGNVDGDFLLRRHFDKVFQITAKLRSAEGGDRTGADALLRIGNDQIFLYTCYPSKPFTRSASSKRIVEGEHLRYRLQEFYSISLKTLAVDPLLAISDLHRAAAIPLTKCRLYRLRDPTSGGILFFYRQPVDQDAVCLRLYLARFRILMSQIQNRLIVDVEKACQPFLFQDGELLLLISSIAEEIGKEDVKPGFLFQFCKQLINDGPGRILFNLSP